MHSSPISFFASIFFCFASLPAGAQTNPNSTATNLFSQPLSRAEAVDIVLKQNSAILKGKTDLEANYGVVIQTRSIALPKISATGNYTARDPASIENFGGGTNVFFQANESWTANLQISQSIYEGGRIKSALRVAKLSKAQAILNYQTVVADALLAARVDYDDVLLAAQQISVQEASVKLLTRELEDVQRRLNAGTVPRFNVLRAQVELASARPRLIRAKNAYRIAKNNLVNVLGYNLPRDVWENIPLQLSDKLEAAPYEIQLPAALGKALGQRPELAALRQAENLRREEIINAQAGYKPSVQLFAGYGSQSPRFRDDLSAGLSGWNAGAQVSWNIFDGALTRGRVIEAEARHRRARIDLDDTGRNIELEVRTAYSNFIEAKEVLESQKKVQEQAEEALRLAEARMSAGTSTQLDVLNAQTALTEARTTQVQSLHDYSVTRARLERAIGENLQIERAK